MILKGGSTKQFEERVREKKRTWTPERLCVGIPNAFEALKFDEDPDYDGQQKALDDMKRLGYSTNTLFHWLEAGDNEGA